jgi:hypothetical protein
MTLDSKYKFSAKNQLRSIPMEEFGEHVQYMHEDRDNLFELEYNVRKTRCNHLIVMRCLLLLLPGNTEVSSV